MNREYSRKTAARRALCFMLEGFRSLAGATLLACVAAQQIQFYLGTATYDLK